MRLRTAVLALALLATPAAAIDFRDGHNSPHLVGPDGRYLGNLNGNPYDPNSVANPFGRYGSEFSPDSVNNPYGLYGNPYRDPEEVHMPPFFEDEGEGE